LGQQSSKKSLSLSQRVFCQRCCRDGYDRKYNRERKTRNLGVVYWVRDDFAAGRDGTASLSQIERHVEEDYIVELQHGCYRERNNSQ